MRALLDLLQENESAVKGMVWQVSELLNRAKSTLKVLGVKAGEGRLNLIVSVRAEMGKMRALSGSVDVERDAFF